MGDISQACRRTKVAPRIAAAGFTLIELMVTVVVAAILAMVAIPSFETTINNSRLATASNEMLVSLQTARMEAIRYNRRTAVCLSNNATSATPTCAPRGTTTANGWITYLDRNSNNQFAAPGDLLLRQSTLPTNVRVFFSPALETANNNQVGFRADGFARTNANVLVAGNVDLCLPVSRPGENVRRLTVAAGSRMGITRQNTDRVCEQPDDP